ncbi:hypothetical protein N9D23_13890 [Rubripirellula sp.]|nr:hypothetical protein [Rubripirellula sp.]MDF1842270.1 hypothetical protein [Rubripirellula sp.]
MSQKRYQVEQVVQCLLHGRSNEFIKVAANGITVNLDGITNLFANAIFWYIRHRQSLVSGIG